MSELPKRLRGYTDGSGCQYDRDLLAAANIIEAYEIEKSKLEWRCDQCGLFIRLRHGESFTHYCHPNDEAK